MANWGFHNVLAWGGEEQSLKEAQRRHLKWFKRASSVLDVGCGRGVFLELLRENRVLGIGIDIDPFMIEACRKKGLEAYCQDPIQHLSAAESRYSGILCSHVIEHMRPEVVPRFLELCYQSLKADGYLVVCTPNASCWSVISHDFWLDTTHVRPYPRVLLEKILAGMNFRIITETDGVVAGPVFRRFVMFFRRWLLGSMVFKIALDTDPEVTIVALKQGPESKSDASSPTDNRLEG